MHDISLDQILNVILVHKRQQDPNFEFDKEQLDAIIHDTGPLWILAGPGTGKTEVLALRCIKHLVVERIPAKSILVTTFTKRAAKQLQQRIASYLSLIREHYNIGDIHESELRVGNLHSLCQDILTERGSQNFRNFRLIDEIQQRMFIYENSFLTKNDRNYSPNELKKCLDFWNHFYWVVRPPTESYKPYGHTSNSTKLPSKRSRAEAAKTLFNSITEMNYKSEQLRSMGGSYSYLADAVDEYRQQTNDSFICDQSYIQLIFRQFLNTPVGKSFVKGDSDINPGIRVLLVDEYQDTNPIQEEIYFSIASRIGNNICIVGDDDQSLYRFRGGTVELMTNFGQRAKERLRLKDDITPIQILNNYRSHEGIVRWLNHYINSVQEMRELGVRAPGKRDLIAKAPIEGEYPAVARIVPQSRGKVAVADQRNEIAVTTADLVQGLIENCDVRPEDICILSRSTRIDYPDSFISLLYHELRRRDFNVYNPRSKTYHMNENITLFLGSLFMILDAGRDTTDVLNVPGYDTTRDYINYCKNTYKRYIETGEGNEIRDYVEKSIQSISDNWDPELEPYLQSYDENNSNRKRSTLREICNHILNCQPFTNIAEGDPDSSSALVEVTKIIDKYASMPFHDDHLRNRDFLRLDSDKFGQISVYDVRKFYQTFLDIITEGYDEPEEEDSNIPDNHIPILTIHSVKGLQFPIVIVESEVTSQHLSKKRANPSREYLLENEFGASVGFGREGMPDIHHRFLQDIARRFYVAYSRPQYALILVSTKMHLNKGNLPFGGAHDGRNYTTFMEILRKEDS